MISYVLRCFVAVCDFGLRFMEYISKVAVDDN